MVGKAPNGVYGVVPGRIHRSMGTGVQTKTPRRPLSEVRLAQCGTGTSSSRSTDYGQAWGQPRTCQRAPGNDQPGQEAREQAVRAGRQQKEKDGSVEAVSAGSSEIVQGGKRKVPACSDKLESDIAAVREQSAAAQEQLIHAAHASGVSFDAARAMEDIEDEDWQQLISSGSMAEGATDSLADDILVARALRRRRAMLGTTSRGPEAGGGQAPRPAGPHQGPVAPEPPLPPNTTVQEGNREGMPRQKDSNSGYAALSPNVHKHRAEPYPTTSPLPAKPPGEVLQAAMDGTEAPLPPEPRESSRPRPPPGLGTAAPDQGKQPSARGGTGNSLEQKLEQRRAADPGPALKPFRQRFPPAAEHTAAPRVPEGPGFIEDDEDGDLNMQSPGFKELE